MSAAYHVGNILRTAHGMYTLGKYAYKFSRWGYKKLAVRRTKSGKWVIPKTKHLRGYNAGKGQTKLHLRGSTGERPTNVKWPNSERTMQHLNQQITHRARGWKWVTNPDGTKDKKLVRITAKYRRQRQHGNPYKSYYAKFKPYKLI